jgi:GAF domain/ANTAR domain
MPVDERGEVTRALLGIARGIPDDRALAEQICRACVAGLDIDGAAISLHTAGTLRETLYATDPTANLLEELQFSLGEGACMDAARSGRPVLIPDMNDLTDTSRWPIYTSAVTEQAGVGAIFALPLQWATINLGVLDLYRYKPGSLARAQLLDAISTADTAALMLLGLRTDPDPDPDPAAGGELGWDGSWANRAEIHQATGMVLSQLGISATDAFARLRAHAFAEQRLLGDVAADVVARRLRFTA